jgi:alpha-tubulin suppressor-like RCC1 family protein
MRRLWAPQLLILLILLAEASLSASEAPSLSLLKVAFRETSPQLRTDSLQGPPRQLTAASLSTREIELRWIDEDTSETSFLIERKTTGSSSFLPVASVDANITQFKDSNLLPETEYVYRVRSESDAGSSIPSNEASATTASVPKKPLAPLNLEAVSITHSQVYLTWQDNSTNELEFRIERKTLAENAFTQIATAPSNATIYQDTNVTPCQQYIYRVRASNTVGDSENSNEVQVTVFSPIIVGALGSGRSHTIALQDDGSVWTWGGNIYGQLGNGTTQDRHFPQQVLLLDNQVMEVNAGENFSIALKSDGTLWTWGANQSGQLGDGSTSNRWSPVNVNHISGVDMVEAGQAHVLAVTTHGSVLSWGKNDFGQLGLPISITKQTVPAPISGFLTPVNEVAAGASHSIALQTDGTVWTWGNNIYGQSGNGYTNQFSMIAQVPGLTDVTKVAAGDYFNLALKADGTVWGWGKNSSGQLGTGSTDDRRTPTLAVGLTKRVINIAAGGNHSLAVLSDGTVWTWGSNSSGQLGNGTTNNTLLPVKVESEIISNIISTAAGYDHSVALQNDGSVLTWGANDQGQLGNNTNKLSSVPVKVLDLISNP